MNIFPCNNYDLAVKATQFELINSQASYITSV